MAAAREGRGERSASRTGSVVAHSHGTSGCTSRSAGPAGDRPRPGRDQVEPVPLQHRDGPGEGVGEQPHVGVDEREDAVVRGRSAPPRPRRRAACRASRAGAGRRAPAGRADRVHPADHSRRAVGRAVVDDDHAQVVDAALVEQGGQAAADLLLLVPDRQHHRDRPAHRSAGSAGGRRSSATLTAAWTAPATETPARARTSRPLTAPRPPVLDREDDQDRDGEDRAPGGRAGQARASPRAPARRRGSSSRWRAAARRRRSGGRPAPRSATSRSSRAMRTSAGQQPAGQVGERDGGDAGQARGRVRPGPVPGLHELRVEDDVPGGEDRRRGDRATRAGRLRRASAGRRAPSSARPSSARRAAPGTARPAGSGRGAALYSYRPYGNPVARPTASNATAVTATRTSRPAPTRRAAAETGVDDRQAGARARRSSSSPRRARRRRSADRRWR